MKNLFIPFLFALFLLTRVNAQTHVEFGYPYLSANQSCTVPVTWSFSSDIQSTNYTTADSVDFYIDFGDSNDTTVTLPLIFMDAIHAASYSPNLTHTYQAAGNYPVVFMATMPDGNADTSNAIAMVTPNCFNVTGHLYLDMNSNCIFDAGDAAIPNIQMRLDYNGYTVSTFPTDANGNFMLTGGPGYTYSLLADTSTTASVDFTYSCSTFEGMPVTPSPLATQDIYVSNTPSVHISFASDSANMTSGNCAPLNAYLYINGGTLGYPQPNDTIDVYINFGDGTDTTISQRAYSNGPANIGSFFAGMPHTYTAVGNYNLLFVATGPDGATDSLIQNNKISITDTCGNVEGNVFIDNNSDCLLNAGDSTNLRMFLRLTNLSLGTSYYGFTDVNGHYSFLVPPGNYSITLLSGVNYNPPLTFTCPASGTTNVTVTAANTVTADFATECQGTFDFAGWIGSFWPGIFSTYTTHIHPYIHNYSCAPVNGTVQLILDPMVDFMGSCDTATAPAVSGDTLTWTFTGNSYMSNWYYWFGLSRCLSIKGDPALQVGDSVCFTMIVNPVSGDINPANNTFTRCMPALVSLDPNTKTVSPRGSGPQGYVAQQTSFEYTIDFQNTGTAMARDIFILDTLDADLDLSTLSIIGSSHFMQPQILPGNILKFLFDDINLPDSTSDEPNSHGWVSYRISAKPALANGTQIQNTAGIYFDFNQPVITNSTLNTIYDPASVNEISANDASVFPNPASSSVEIKFSKETEAIYRLTDVTSKEVTSGKINGMTATIDVSKLAQGVYFLQLNNEEGRSVHKIMVQH